MWIGWMVVPNYEFGMVIGLNLGRPKIKLFFAKFSLAWTWKVRGTLAALGATKGGWKNSHKLWMANKST